MELIFSKAVIKDVRRLKNKQLILRVERVIYELKKASSLDSIQGVKKLKGHPNAYRMRIGDYRLGFYVRDERIILARFVKRNDIYEVFPKK